MDQTTTGPTTATTDPARRRGLARVLLACSVLALALRPVASAVLLGSTGDDFGVMGHDMAPVETMISVLNVIVGLLTLVAAGLAVAVIVLGAVPLARRTPGAGGWHETTGMGCVAAAVLVLCLPLHLLPFEPEPLMAVYTVASAIAVVAALMALVFVGLALQGPGQTPHRSGRARALLSTILAAGSVLVLSVSNTGMFIPLYGPSVPWIQSMVLVIVVVMALLSLVLAVLSRRGTAAPGVSEELPAAPSEHAPQTETETETDRGLLALRLLATPAAMALLVLSLVFVQSLTGLMLVSGLLALAAVIGAVVELRRRTDGHRWLDAVGEILVPGALLLPPLGVLIFSLVDDSGWGVLAGMVWGWLLALVVGLLGLVFSVVSVIGGRQESPIGAISALATAATFIPIALLVPLLSAGNGAPVVAVVAGLFLLLGPVAGGLAVGQRHDRF